MKKGDNSNAGVRVYLTVKNHRGDGEIVLMIGQYIPNEKQTMEMCEAWAENLKDLEDRQIMKMSKRARKIRRTMIMRPGENYYPPERATEEGRAERLVGGEYRARDR
jgi:hypothetical protein